MDESWQRARNSNQIEDRINAILSAAEKVFHEHAYENVTMLMISKEAGFTRSNLYRYFKTREEIFLALYIADVKEWSTQVISSFTKELSIETFVHDWTNLLCKQKRLLTLSPILAISLEKNISEDVFRTTKESISEGMIVLVSVLQKALPFLSETMCLEFLLVHQAILSGAWPMAQYSSIQKKVLAENKFRHLKIDFKIFYEKTILIYIKGLQK